MTLYELEQKLKQLRMHSVDDATPVIVAVNDSIQPIEIENIHVTFTRSHRYIAIKIII